MERVYLTWHDVEELITKIVMQLNTPYDALLLITRGRHRARRDDRRGVEDERYPDRVGGV